jgi:hypothetical protein
MRRLPEVRACRLDGVVWADRDIDDLILIPVVVPEQQDLSSILGGTPSFEGCVNRFTANAEGLERQRARGLGLRLGRLRLAGTDDDPTAESNHDRQGRDRGPRRRLHYLPPVIP